MNYIPNWDQEYSRANRRPRAPISVLCETHRQRRLDPIVGGGNRAGEVGVTTRTKSEISQCKSFGRKGRDLQCQGQPVQTRDEGRIQRRSGIR